MGEKKKEEKGGGEKIRASFPWRSVKKFYQMRGARIKVFIGTHSSECFNKLKCWVYQN
jgi:hypothetical protein